MSEQAVSFHSGKNRVYGILHRPDHADEQTARRGIVFLNAGCRYRAGPYRLYIRLARNLAHMGINVLRFDLPGIGESEGVLLDTSDFQRQFIEHNESASAAVTFMQDEIGIEQIGLTGLCGGAFAALRAGVGDPRVRFLLLLSLPVERLGDLSQEAAQDALLRQYFRKALQWRSWRNLFLLRSNFRVMARAMTRITRVHQQFDLVDESLWKDFHDFTRSNRPLMFVYGSSDPLYESFRDAYPPRIGRLSPQHQGYCNTLVVDKGNHTFSNHDWQQQITTAAADWLTRLDGSHETFKAKQAIL